MGAMALFGEKYGSEVRVVTLGTKSVELCGGTHVAATGELGTLRLALAAMLKAPRGELVTRVEALQQQVREQSRVLESLEAKLSSSAGKDLAASAETLGTSKRLFAQIPDGDAKSLRALADSLRQELGESMIVLAGEKNGKVALVAAVTDGLHDRVKAGELLGEVAQALGGRGGGRADLAQGGAPSLDALDAAFARAREFTTERAG